MEKIVDGLVFELRPDGESYRVAGRDKSLNKDEITIPSKIDDIPVVEIDAFAFWDSPVEKVTISEGVRIIGEQAFKGCALLTQISIPKSVANIGAMAFDRCTSLTSITIPDRVTRIGDYALCNCNNLASIKLSANLHSIGDAAFANTALTSIEIPQGLKNIGDSAFEGCRHLTSITFPDSVTEIGDWALRECTNLKDIKFPTNVHLGKDVLYDCKSLESITFGKTKFVPETLQKDTHQNKSDRDSDR